MKSQDFVQVVYIVSPSIYSTQVAALSKKNLLS